MTQMTPEQINAALAAGIISETQAQAMRAEGGKIAVQTRAAQSLSDNNQSVIGNEDDMRFVRSFSDVFIAIGIGLFALGVSAFAVLMGGGISFLLAAGVMAVLAEYFGKRKRQHLPTLITALAFLIFTQRGVGTVLGDMGLGGDITTALITLVAMLVFYWRIRLPFCMALIAVSLLYLFYAVVGRIAPDTLRSAFGWFLFAGGLLTFAAAIIYDMRDQHRQTRFADNAFWLHFTAAPLVIHGLAISLLSLKSETLFNIFSVPVLNKGDAALLMAIILAISILGLAINRRALIVSSLGYAAFAIGFLIKDTGLGIGSVLAVTLLILGAAIIFLGAGWHGARAGLLKILPNWRIFPPPFDPNFKP